MISFDKGHTGRLFVFMIFWVFYSFAVLPLQFSPFTPDSVKSKTDKFSKITIWVNLKNKQQLHSKVLLNSFPVNGHTSVHRIIVSPRFHSGNQRVKEQKIPHPHTKF